MGQRGRGLIRFKTSGFKRLINPLEALTTDGLKQKQAGWVFAKKAYEKQFVRWMDKVEQLLEEDIGKGFVKVDDDNSILSEQKVRLVTIKRYFQSISINIIKE